ncbi:hypothetical protein [Lacrimispora brassicae]
MRYILLDEIKKYEEISAAEIVEGLAFTSEQVIRNLPDLTDKFTKVYSENEFY